MKLQDVVRYAIAAVLIYFAYQETGPVTALLFALLFWHTELVAMKIRLLLRRTT